MKKSLISSHFAHHRPRDKLVTYYIYCYDKEERERSRTVPKKNSRVTTKKRHRPKR